MHIALARRTHDLPTHTPVTILKSPDNLPKSPPALASSAAQRGALMSMNAVWTPIRHSLAPVNTQALLPRW